MFRQLEQVLTIFIFLKNGTSGIKQIEELVNLNFACTVGGIPDISNSEFLSFIEQNELAEADISIKIQ